MFQAFNLDLSFGPYALDFSMGGRQLLLGGEKGAMNMIDCADMKAMCEVNVRL